jgi:V8-like Glu-specific endopeptidase
MRAKIVPSVLLAAMILFVGGGVMEQRIALAQFNPGAVGVSPDRAVTTATHVWTLAEMAAARPMPMPDARALSTDNNNMTAPRRLGSPGFAPGSAAAPELFSGLSAGAGAVPLDDPVPSYAYPPPFTRYENFPATLNQYKQVPYKTIGKLFFTIPGQGNFVCSAASIGNYAIWTAGHCVVSPGGIWHTDIQFVPGYRDGAAPYGVFTGSFSISLTGWIINGDLRYDSGVVVLNKNVIAPSTTLRKVSQRVGWLGFAWNWPHKHEQSHWAMIGYPQAAPFNGLRQHICQASWAYNDTLLAFPLGNNGKHLPTGAGCDQTGGTSGGPWIRQYGTSNWLNGNQSYRRVLGGVEQTKELFTPYFDNDSKSLWDCAQNSGPGVLRCAAPPVP